MSPSCSVNTLKHVNTAFSTCPLKEKEAILTSTWKIHVR